MRKIKLLTLLAALVCAANMWAAPAVAVNGKLPGAFTINADGDQVWFSQGNLQYVGTWQFAENQWDYFGTDQYNDHRDLFDFGTGKNPNYTPASAIGYSLSDDWGINLITNGGNTANLWRTLTSSEWKYLIEDRTPTSGVRYAKATVNNLAGLIILPDDWSTSYYALSNTNTAGAAYTSNEISSADWTSMLETHGAVFLPAAGTRNGSSTPENVGVNGYYNSTTPSENASEFLYFTSSLIHPKDILSKKYGMSVRLVSETAYPTPTDFAITANEDPQNASVYYSTFYHGAADYTLPAGVEAYTAAISGDALNLTKVAEAGQTIPANNAVILKSNVQNYTLAVSALTSSIYSGNSLQGVNAATTNPNYGNIYVLSAEDGSVGFYKLADGATIPAHKAYVTLPGGGAGAPKRLRFVFDAATSVDQITNDQSPMTNKVLRDGQLIIIRNGVEYNANGQIVK